MDPTTVAYAIVLVLFVLVFLAILAYTIATSRPRPQKELHGPEAIEAAIERYDQLQRSRWNRFAYLTTYRPFYGWRRSASRDVPGTARKRGKPRRHRHHHS